MAGNHNSGRRPMPTEWRLINGTARSDDRRAAAVQPDMPQEEPEMPDDIPEEAQWKWLETVELMRQMGTLSVAYSDLLRMYAETWAIYRDATRKVRQIGAAIVKIDKKEKTVSVKTNPLERVMRQSRQDLMRMEIELGLTPSAKSRLIIPKKTGVSARKRHG
jgi:P27 family predicted phage terminase small subunit